MSDRNRVAFENDLPRVDIRQKVTGSARYASDIAPKGMIHASYIRFPYGTGRVKSANLEAARAVPGVLQVNLDMGIEARYCGARIGHIAAESRQALEDGIAALALEFESTGAKTAPEKGEGAPPALDGGAQGRLDKLFKDADVVIEATYETQVQTHSSLEPHGGVVDFRGDSAEAWGSTQGTSAFLDGLAGPLGLPAAKIEVHCEYVGGGFGSKLNGAGPEGDLAAKMSREFKRPCRMFNNRREEHLDTGNRPGSIQSMKIAADKTGKLLGGRIHCASIVGFESGGGGARNPFVYDFGAVEASESEIRLSAGLPAAFRAPGHPQGCFAVQSLMDELAAKLGLDPIAIRKLNETSDRRRKQLDIGAEVFGWSRRKPDGTWPGRIRKGFGVASGHWYTWPGACLADVDIHRDGHVEARSGVQDIGTGTFTVVADVAAHELQIERSKITALVGNSRYPQGPGSGGSVVTRSVYPAVRDAAAKALDELKSTIASEWGCGVDRVVYAKGAFRQRGTDERLSWEEACSLIKGEKISARGSMKNEYLREGETDATQFAEVDVDTETGIVRVVKIVAVQTSGQIVNRLTAENQVCGGVLQGVSYALLEDRRLDPSTGAMVNADFLGYKIAGTLDTPEIVPVFDWTEADTGVRSLGEPVTIPTAGAIANAVANAIGARVRALPITPRRVLEALAAKGGAA